jgi:hypothetical protein
MFGSSGKASQRRRGVLAPRREGEVFKRGRRPRLSEELKMPPNGVHYERIQQARGELRRNPHPGLPITAYFVLRSK